MTKHTDTPVLTFANPTQLQKNILRSFAEQQDCLRWQMSVPDEYDTAEALELFNLSHECEQRYRTATGLTDYDLDQPAADAACA